MALFCRIRRTVATPTAGVGLLFAGKPTGRCARSCIIAYRRAARAAGVGDVGQRCSRAGREESYQQNAAAARVEEKKKKKDVAFLHEASAKCYRVLHLQICLMLLRKAMRGPQM